MRPIFERRGFALTPNGTGGLRATIGAGFAQGLGVELSVGDVAELQRAVVAWHWSEPAREHLAEHARLADVERVLRASG